MFSLIIVDDEEKIATGIGMLFPWEDIGFEVRGVFTSARDALAFLDQNEVDVVMTDVEMPDMTGIDFAYEIRRRYNCRIVFFSSYDRYEYLRDAMKTGAEDYLLKPIRYKDLLECFDRVKEKLNQDLGRNTAAENPSDIIELVRQYLNENYQNATLEEAAEQANLSPTYLSHFFKEKSGVGFRELLLKTRMEKACSLLEDRDYQVYDIAYYVGYDNPKNFSRAFKAYYGLTPGEYKKNHEKGKS